MELDQNKRLAARKKRNTQDKYDLRQADIVGEP